MSLPSGYNRLEYIKSSGAQYIDTGFKHNQNTRVVMDAQLTSAPSVNCWLFEGRNATGTSGASKSVFFYQTSTKLWTSDYNGSGDRLAFSGISSTDRLKIDYNKNVCTINGQTQTHSETTFQSKYNLFLLADNRAGTVYGPCNAKLYSCQIYDNGTLIRDFIPCQTTSGEIGLWDDVNSVFYGNAGTGTFTAGPEIPAPEDPTALQTVLAVVLQWAASANADRYDIYRDDAKLGSTETTQYVDTTPEANQTYVYTVKAVNGGGESAGTSITVYTKSGYFEYKPLIESANFP